MPDNHKPIWMSKVEKHIKLIRSADIGDLMDVVKYYERPENPNKFDDEPMRDAMLREIHLREMNAR